MKQWSMQVPSQARPRGQHSCQCLCAACEASGAGYFAQLALLSGDTEAGRYLSAEVCRFLAAEGSALSMEPTP